MTRLALLLARCRETARSMVGMPSYAVYAAHMAERHPGVAIMDETAFFRDRQRHRYGGGGGGGRCC